MRVVVALVALAMTAAGCLAPSSPADGREAASRVDANADRSDQAPAMTLEERLAAVAPSRALPVLLVHGYNFWGANDAIQWTGLMDAFAGWGWGEEVAPWAYYGCDAPTAYRAEGHGDHGTHFGGPAGHESECAPGGHDYDTPIEHLGYHLAWTIHDEFTEKGTCINVIAHSMGGLITRYALAHAGALGFPPFLCVRGVVTMGTPHLGYGGTMCGFDYQSCTQMAPGSALLSSLATGPQGLGGTRWTLIGSDGDNVITPESALGGQAHSFVRYTVENDINHASGKNYMHAYWRPEMAAAWKDSDEPFYEADDRTAWVVVQEGETTRESRKAPWPVRWADLALATGAPVAPPEHVPYVGEAIRISPEAADVVGARGQEGSFQGGCRDPEATLSKAQWQLFDGSRWYAEHEDHVRIWDDPWTSTRRYPIDSDFTLRFVCVYDIGSSPYTEWQVAAAGSPGSQSAGQTYAAGVQLAVPGGEVRHHAFNLEAGLRVTFDWYVTDSSTLDAGIIAHDDLASFERGESVNACGAANDASSGGSTCVLGQGAYNLVFRCRNSTFDCDLEYSLYSHE